MANRKNPDQYRKTGLLARLVEDVRLLFSLIRDFSRGDYRRVPVWSIIVFLAACAYILFPLDLIPDYLPVIGQIDDAFIALLAIFLLEKDLHAYKAWKNRQQ